MSEDEQTSAPADAVAAPADAAAPATDVAAESEEVSAVAPGDEKLEISSGAARLAAANDDAAAADAPSESFIVSQPKLASSIKIVETETLARRVSEDFKPTRRSSTTLADQGGDEPIPVISRPSRINGGRSSVTFIESKTMARRVSEDMPHTRRVSSTEWQENADHEKPAKGVGFTGATPAPAKSSSSSKQRRPTGLPQTKASSACVIL